MFRSLFAKVKIVPRRLVNFPRIAVAGVSFTCAFLAYRSYTPSNLILAEDKTFNGPTLTGEESSLKIDGVDVPIVRNFPGQDPGDSTRPRLIILGTGWGATSILKELNPGQYSTVVISKTNYFLFTPLLPEATTGTVESRSLQESARKICLKSRATFWEGEAYDVLPDLKLVHVKTNDGSQFLVPYDKLVISIGAQNATFGVPGVKENTNFLKTINDARQIRYQLMNLFERAALPLTTEEEKTKLLSFVVAGGGPTGVEFAAALHDFIHEDVSKHFHHLVPYAKVHIIQSSEHILNAFAETISQFAEHKFRRGGIDLITQARVTKVEPNKIIFKKKNVKPGENDTVELDFGLCVWSTGIEARDTTKRIIARLSQQQNTKALITDARLKVKGAEDIYALGDAATIENPKLVNLVIERFKKAGVKEILYEDFEKICREIMEKHPQTRVHLKKLEKMFEDYDEDGSSTLDMVELEKLFKNINSKLTSLPATAQVASQQGKYLANKLNKLSDVANTFSWKSIEDSMPPFDYFHLGSFSYIGGENAVYDFGNYGQGGWWVTLLWRGAYLSEQVSLRTRTLLAMDWMKKKLFGRDISRS